MAKGGNPNPVHKFSSTNQPKTRRKSNKALTALLRRKLREQPDGGKKWMEELIDLIRKELRMVTDGEKPMESLHVKLIDMLWDRFEGPVTQEHEHEVSVTGGAILIPENMEKALAVREKEGAKPVESDEEEDE